MKIEIMVVLENLQEKIRGKNNPISIKKKKMSWTNLCKVELNQEADGDK